MFSLYFTVLSCAFSFTHEVQCVVSIKRCFYQLLSIDCKKVLCAQKYVADVHNSEKCALEYNNS